MLRERNEEGSSDQFDLVLSDVYMPGTLVTAPLEGLPSSDCGFCCGLWLLMGVSACEDTQAHCVCRCQSCLGIIACLAGEPHSAAGPRKACNRTRRAPG
jgi:hypothetical protein